MERTLHKAEETIKMGQALGGWLQGGDILSLVGDLGAGKTTLTQGIAQGLGIEEPVTSPTFTLIHEYEGRLALYHMDFYRLTDPTEAEVLGLEEYLEGDGVSVLEWMERLEDQAPDEYLEIRLTYVEEGRRMAIIPHGPRWAGRIEELEKICEL